MLFIELDLSYRMEIWSFFRASNLRFLFVDNWILPRQVFITQKIPIGYDYTQWFLGRNREAGPFTKLCVLWSGGVRELGYEIGDVNVFGRITTWIYEI